MSVASAKSCAAGSAEALCSSASPTMRQVSRNMVTKVD